jgi:integrase
LAERLAHNRRTDVLDGRVRRRTVKLSALIKTYQSHIEQDHRTADKAERVLADFLEFIGDRRLSDISGFHIEKWKIGRAKDVEQSTVNRELNIIRGLFRSAVGWKMLTASPVDGVKKYHVDDTRVRVLSEAEIRTVLTKAPAEIALLCRATLECLPRLSELLALRREHIGSTWIEIRRKGGRVERVEVSPELRNLLLERAKGNGFVFVGRTGEPPCQECVSSYITRVMRGLGLPGVSHHTMRHTGVTLMLEAGVNPRVIQKLAGWTTLRMLERYGHARDAEARRAVSAMHELVERAINRPVDSIEAASTPESYTKRAQKRAQQGSD